MTDPLQEILCELRARCPLQLDGTPTLFREDGTPYVYADDHQFVVSLPARVFRLVKSLPGSPREVRTLAAEGVGK